MYILAVLQTEVRSYETILASCVIVSHRFCRADGEALGVDGSVAAS